MRIAAVYDRFVRGGGLENYLTDFVSHLASRGHEVSVITSKTDAETEKYPVEIIQLRRAGLTGAGKMLDFDNRAGLAVRDLAPDISIGFGRTTSHDLHRAGGGCHRVYSQLLPITKRLSAKNRAELQLERKLYRSGKTKHFIANSQMVANQLREAYRLSEEQLSVVHTAVDSERFHPAEDESVRREICAELRTDPSVTSFLFVSLGHRRKGLDTIIEAWRETEGHLWIVGNPLRAETVKAIKRAGLEQRVFYFGRVEDAAPFYQAADFFLHPTLYDACANTVLQAMSSGLPGLISTHDGAAQFIEENTNGLLLKKPWEPTLLAETVAKANAMTTNERSKMGQAARKSVEHLSWDHHMNAWLELIDKRFPTPSK